MTPLSRLVSLVLAPLLGALRALGRWWRVDAPPAAVLVPVRLRAGRPALRLPAPRPRHHD